MKSLLFLVLLFSMTANATPPDEPTSELNSESIGAIRAILASPNEAADFNAKSKLMNVNVVQNSANEIMYKFEGKRLQPGGYRQLFIYENHGTTGDVNAVTYKAVLVQ